MGRPRSWTDADLRAAVAVARSWRDVCALLGLAVGGDTVARLALRAEQLEVDRGHLPERAAGTAAPAERDAGRARAPWSRESLALVVRRATDWRDVCRTLGEPIERAAWDRLRKRCHALHIDTRHLTNRSARQMEAPVAPAARGSQDRPAARRWTDEDLRDAVAAARSWAGVHKGLGITIGGSTYGALQHHAARLRLSTSHFTGRGWTKGMRDPLPGTRIPLERLLVEAPPMRVQSHKLRLRLIREGVKRARCEQCGITEWQGHPAPLQLHHVNGNRNDCRLENLHILCANCHALTDTWCGKNIGIHSRGDAV